MKTLLLALALVTTNAFALEVCSFKETVDFEDALTAKKIKPVKISSNAKTYSAEEKKLILDVVSGGGRMSMKEALEQFSGGGLVYYKIKGELMVLVHYYPGDNEYGSYFVFKNGKWVFKAMVVDSFIEC